MEEVMNKIGYANESLASTTINSLALGSMDVTALYPFLDQEGASKILAEEIIESN